MNKQTDKIGDGQLPNMYWVEVYNDYYYYNEDVGGYDWVSDRDDINVSGDTYGPYLTYQDAMNKAHEFDIGESLLDSGDTIMGLSIVDRITGEIYSNILEEYTRVMTDYQLLESIDTRFTKDKLESEGYIFE